MAAALAQHLDQQVRAPVDHFGGVAEVRRRVDHAQEFEGLDPREIAGGRLGGCQQPKPDQLRVLIGFLPRKIAADLAANRLKLPGADR